MGKIADLLGISEAELDKIERESTGGSDWADIPDRTWTLAEVVKAEPRTSKAGNVCANMEYKVIALPASLPEANYGQPHVWDNGGMLNVPKETDMTGQPEEAITTYRKTWGRFAHRFKAHGLDPDTCMVDDPTDLPVANLVGVRLLLRVKTQPAGSTFEQNSETKTRKRNG